MNIEDIKTKIDALKKRENDVTLRESMIDSAEEMTQKILAAFESLQTLMQENQNKELTAAFDNLIKELKKVERNNSANLETFGQTFIKGVETMTSTIVNENITPVNTLYARNNQDQITKVIETYENKIVEYSWSYDSRGNLSTVNVITK